MCNGLSIQTGSNLIAIIGRYIRYTYISLGGDRLSDLTDTEKILIAYNAESATAVLTADPAFLLRFGRI